MKRFTTALITAWVASATLFAAPVLAADKVKMEQVPRAAQETIKREVGNSKVEHITKTTRDNKVIFDVEWEEPDGTNYEMRVRQDGKIIKKGTNWF